MAKMVSPNDMLAAAENMMLDGREPSSREDWQIVMNFFAVNVHPDIAESACLLLKTLFDIPLSNDEVKEIVEFQRGR